MLIGFARASRCGPPLKDQRAALRAAGCAEVIEVQARGGAMEALDRAMSRLGSGDQLVTTSLDRLPGSLRDVVRVAARLTSSGASLRVLAPALEVRGEALAALDAAAELERDRRAERQKDGIESRRAAGGYTRGRPKAAEPSEIKAALAAGESATSLARRLGIGRATVYRLAAGAQSAG